MRLSIWPASAAPRNHSNAWVREYLAASFSPDGRLVVVGCVDNAARVLEVATGWEVVRPLLHDNWVRAVAFGPDSRGGRNERHRRYRADDHRHELSLLETRLRTARCTRQALSPSAGRLDPGGDREHAAGGAAPDRPPP
ncbi:MAG: Anaphase-promoting complex subunit 4 domain, partial [Actinomycetota bacterium]|nr:Anaphase-promoting complex subunit 4 domain [Actinomycetota bacterium]